MHLACAIYLGALFCQRARPYRLPVISYVLRFCRNSPCSCPCSQLGFCVHVDEPSVIGLSIRTRSQLYWGSSSFFKAEGRVEGHPNSNSKGVNPVAECSVVLYTCHERDTPVPVGLILAHVVSEVLSQHTVTPLNTSLRFWMERGGLNLNFEDLTGFLKCLTNKVGALIRLQDLRCAIR